MLSVAPGSRCREVALARRPVVDQLAAVPGVTIHTLEETYHPPAPSLALHPPARAFTPATPSRLVQHLVDVTVPAGFSSCHGLLASGSCWLYEANPANAAGPDRRSLSKGAVLASLLRRRWNGAAVPPGWWRRAPVPRSEAGPLVLLTSHNNPNYHHWLMVPGMAPLMLQRRFGLEVDPQTRLALTAPPGRPHPPYLRPLLALVAPELSVLEAAALTAPRLRFALQEHGSDVVVSPALLDWWRQRWDAVAPPGPPPARRLFISRQGARSRRCLNEDALMAQLAPLGFERLHLEALPMRQQLEAFASAEVVVGVHGAGLTNLVACRQGATLVELLPGDGPFNHYFLMASLLGVRHGHLIGTRPDPSREDLTVDPDQLVALLIRCGIGAER
ncbi:MAG: glycosyltransferase family 61 protein [Cyanobacteriota bacterium]|nr:glycosyltransferase family 61 protein [Cyanobacteriota bacterium]